MNLGMGLGLTNQRQYGSTVTYDTDAQAYFDKIASLGGATPADAKKTIINDLVLALKAASLWTIMDAIELHAFNDVTTSLINLVNPAIVGSKIGGLSDAKWTVNKGWMGDTDKCISTGVNLTTTTNFTGAGGTLGVYFTVARTPATINPIGSRASVTEKCNGMTQISVNTMRGYILSSSASYPATTEYLHSNTGMLSISLNGTDKLNRLYKDGAILTQLDETARYGAGNLYDGYVYVCAMNDGGTVANPMVTGNIGISFIGADMASAQHLALSGIFDTFITALSA